MTSSLVLSYIMFAELFYVETWRLINKHTNHVPNNFIEQDLSKVDYISSLHLIMFLFDTSSALNLVKVEQFCWSIK